MVKRQPITEERAPTASVKADKARVDRLKEQLRSTTR